MRGVCLPPVRHHEHPRNVGLLDNSAWDQQYLHRITWAEHDPRVRPHPLISARRADTLASHVLRDDDQSVIFGVDGFGHPVARGATKPARALAPWPSRPDTTVTILWPVHTHLEHLPTHTRIVGTGDIGDRPAYLAHHERIIGLLPRQNNHNGWNFGYSGGGPGYLASAAAAFLTDLAGLSEDNQLHVYKALVPLVDDRSQWDHLDVDLTTLTA